MWILKVCIQRKPKVFSALALTFSKWGKFVTIKRCFKKFCKDSVFPERYNENCYR